MGYRLEIYETKHKACGGKLYGYENEKKLKSYNYLLKNGFLEGDEYFGYGFEGNIVLTQDEFKEFVELYNEDLNECRSHEPKDWFINNEEVKELLEDYHDKLLKWY